jgi:hypothetical protein
MKDSIYLYNVQGETGGFPVSIRKFGVISDRDEWLTIICIEGGARIEIQYSAIGVYYFYTPRDAIRAAIKNAKERLRMKKIAVKEIKSIISKLEEMIC